MTYSNIESDWIDGILMSVKSLDALAGTNIPHWYSFISGSRCKNLGIWLPCYTIYWIDVTSVGESWFFHIHVPHFDGVIHRARQQKVTSIVESYFPNGLAMFCPSMSAASVDKVPNLNSSVTRCSCEKISSWVESASTNPILMSFTTHNEVSGRNTPQLPCGVITSCGYNVFLRVVT